MYACVSYTYIIVRYLPPSAHVAVSCPKIRIGRKSHNQERLYGAQQRLICGKSLEISHVNETQQERERETETETKNETETETKAITQKVK